LAEFRVETFEQPLQADDWEGMIRLTRESPVPIEADQTVKSVTDATRVIRDGAAKVITTSPQKVGGIFRAKRIADLCEAAELPCIVSNVGGSRLNDAAACQVIASSAAARLPCEVGEFERLMSDPASGLEVRNGEIEIPTTVGLGVKVDF
jgi:L-alanine-DL-glutamate epimerase-like enolase superfamily enzyme